MCPKQNYQQKQRERMPRGYTRIDYRNYSKYSRPLGNFLKNRLTFKFMDGNSQTAYNSKMKQAMNIDIYSPQDYLNILNGLICVPI